MKLKFPRESYYPKGAVKVASKASSAVVFAYERAGRLYACGFSGKADKPAINYSFRSAEARAKYVARWMANVADGEARRKAADSERKAKLALPHGLKLGDVLSGSWGYDQTNVEFWQVTKLVGKRLVEIRELACESVETGFMSGNAVPQKDVFTSKEPKVRRVNESDSVKLFDWGVYLSKARAYEVAGKIVAYKPAGWSSYA
jgi:hypothetical protein